MYWFAALPLTTMPVFNKRHITVSLPSRNNFIRIHLKIQQNNWKILIFSEVKSFLNLL